MCGPETFLGTLYFGPVTLVFVPTPQFAVWYDFLCETVGLVPQLLHKCCNEHAMNIGIDGIRGKNGGYERLQGFSTKTNTVWVFRKIGLGLAGDLGRKNMLEISTLNSAYFVS